MEEPAVVVNITSGQLSALTKGIDLSKVRALRPELEALCNRKIEAAADFANLVKIAALQAGIDPAVLSSYITAVCTDTLRKKEKQAEQLSLLFGEL